MAEDMVLHDACGNVVASFGPRKAGTGPDGPGDSFIEHATDEAAEFWSVFRHDAEGFARCVGDANDALSARNFAAYAVRADPVTAAFVAIGVHRYLGEPDVAAPPDLRGFIATIVRFSSAVERAVDGYADLCGVTACDVAEPFGHWAAGQLLVGELNADHVDAFIKATAANACK